VGAGAHDKFVTAIAGGKVPDVAEITTWTPEFADQGGLVEQPGFVGRLRLRLVDAATLNGKVYGKPWYAGARALIYRKDILEKAGIDKPPATWDDDGRVQADQGQGAGRLPGQLHRPERAHVPADHLAGGRADRHAGRRQLEVRSTRRRPARRSSTTRPSTRTGWTKAAVGWEEPDAQTAFINDVAMLIAGGWTYNSIIDTKPGLKDKIGTALEPAGPSGKDTAFAGGRHQVQFQESRTRTSAPRSSTSCSSPPS
jgi:N,N'-diacetylchitobiose transport system substrate-binding protein